MQKVLYIKVQMFQGWTKLYTIVFLLWTMSQRMKSETYQTEFEDHTYFYKYVSVKPFFIKHLSVFKNDP